MHVHETVIGLPTTEAMPDQRARLMVSTTTRPSSLAGGVNLSVYDYLGMQDSSIYTKVMQAQGDDALDSLLMQGILLTT